MEPNQEQIQEWKKTYGRVRKIKLDDTDYYYRGVSLPEYQNIEKLIEVDPTTTGEIDLVKLCLLFPTLPEKPGAGIVRKVSDAILVLSGFGQNSGPEEL